MNNFLPEQNETNTRMAEQMLEVLEVNVQWFRIPTQPGKRDLLVRRWAGAIADSGLTEDVIKKALALYLRRRWAKDPTPEPRDILGISSNDLMELMGDGDFKRMETMRKIRRYTTMATNWRGGYKGPFDPRENAHAFRWESMNTDTPKPDDLPMLLRAMGFTGLAEINQ